jgi:hypothetical protein
MTSVILLFSLLNPTHLQDYAQEWLSPETTEPHCDVIDRMLAKYDSEYELELALETASSVFSSTSQ